MQATATAPPKPWERAGRRVSTAVPPVAGASTAAPVAEAAAVASTAAPVAGSTAAVSSAVASSRALSPVATSNAYGSSMYGSSMYGRSMYGSGYGSSMYGGLGSSMYGGYGGSMYGSTYGRGYGNGVGMYGGRQQDSEFFAPKQKDQPAPPGRLSELGELNASFLESLHTYGKSLCEMVQQLLGGLARLHAAVRAGTVAPAAARRAAALAVAAAAICAARLAQGAVRRQQRRLAWEALFVHAAAPLPLGLGAGAVMPRASL